MLLIVFLDSSYIKVARNGSMNSLVKCLYVARNLIPEYNDNKGVIIHRIAALIINICFVIGNNDFRVKEKK